MNINYASKLYALHKRLSLHLIITLSLILKPLARSQTLFTFVWKLNLILRADEGKLNLKPELQPTLYSKKVLLIYSFHPHRITLT